MTFFKTGAALSIAAALGAMTLLPVSANAQASCAWYASTALKQEQENQRLKCGFTGPEWSLDLKGHTLWCKSVPPETWKASAQKRKQMLTDCSEKKS